MIPMIYSDKEFIGKTIQTIRKKANIKQSELAEKIGISEKHLSKIETGYYFTSYENLQKIAKALNLTMKDLFDFSEDELTKAELIKLITKDIKTFETNDLKTIRKMINLYFECKQ